MNWDAIGTVAELIGAAGVILSLVYVGSQLKLTNTQSRADAHYARSQAVLNFSTSVACSPRLCEILAKVHFHGLVRDDATEPERMHLGYLYGALVSQIQLAFDQYKEGIISKEELESLSGPTAGVLGFPYLASVWPILKPSYSPDFQGWFETWSGVKHTSSGAVTKD